jgi:histidinol-phosphate aminotransferase
MSFSRRGFMRTLGIGGGGAISAALISGRGHEDLMGLGGAFDTPLYAAGDERIRLSSNENPRGPAPAALEAVRGALGVSNRYPGGFGSRALAEGLARFHDLSPDNLVLGAGSGEVLRMAVAAFTSPTRHLVDANPTFESPGRYARVIGTSVRSVPVDDRLRLDLGGMAEQAGEAGLVFVCNPNNPTATVHSAEAIRELVHRVNRASPETVLLIDEAYHEFVDDPSYATALSLAVENPTVIVSRTFSKIYGMAGLRVGYGVGHPETIRRMRPHKLGSSVNVLGAAAALASLDLDAHVPREAELNREARDYTRQVFTDLGFTVAPSQTNFVMAHIQRDVKEFQRACREQGILVGRPFPPLTDYARVSIGTLDEMRQAADVFRKVLGPSSF